MAVQAGVQVLPVATVVHEIESVYEGLEQCGVGSHVLFERAAPVVQLPAVL